LLKLCILIACRKGCNAVPTDAEPPTSLDAESCWLCGRREGRSTGGEGRSVRANAFLQLPNCLNRKHNCRVTQNQKTVPSSSEERGEGCSTHCFHQVRGKVWSQRRSWGPRGGVNWTHPCTLSLIITLLLGLIVIQR
jgi:hypothetical protein